MGIPLNGGGGQYVFDQSKDVSSHIREFYDYDGDLLSVFAGNKGKIVHKWHHYIPLYDRYFARYRGTKVRMLEIGVYQGGSLGMWRKYFGNEAIIYGIDINPECAAFNGHDGQVRIGSQADSGFLESVVAEMGGVDIVLDDGSHEMKHIHSSLKALFPLLSNGGTYFIEDLHTCYWRPWGGGYGSKDNFFHVVGELINDMHHWYHDSGFVRQEIGSALSGIHIHDSIVVLEKGSSCPPVHSQVG
jgi:hypothetical protein